MKVYIVGEDPVTYAIIKRVLAYCSGGFEIIAELPDQGGQVKSKILEFNALSISDKNDNFIFNIAVDEAEAWLMADREGFANYFKIILEDMPTAHKTKQGGRKTLTEMNFSYKSSMFLTHELIKKSKHLEFIRQLTPKKGAAKGPEYNSCMLPFIQNIWNIDNARQNTDSLNRMIVRLQNLANS
jgi:hypothetical protein